MIEKGQLGSYLQDVSLEAQSKLDRHLTIRQNMIAELNNRLNASITKIKKITISYGLTCQDIIMSLQYVVKNLSKIYTLLEIKARLDEILFRTKYLSLELQYYLINLCLKSQRKNLIPKEKFANKKLKIL
jgi:predicted CDP-diglyceride synthetase/phosphatidate cytidylyltransferase